MSRAFTIEVPTDDLVDLQRRVAATRWPASVEGAGWSLGTDVAWLRDLCDYWARDFRWPAQEAYLNSFDHRLTRIGELDIHYIHERGKGPHPIPLVLTHGWPSTFFEFHKVIEKLTDPAADGADPADAFDVVIPSLPGYGFSSASPRPGVTTNVIADLWVELMTGLGYDRFAAHGGDWGSAVTGALATNHADRMLAVHFTTVAPPYDPASLEGHALSWWRDLQAYRDAEWGYVHLQRTKPQTPAFALNDSPVGLAAWILEKWWRWSDCIGPNGERDPLNVYSRDDLLTTVSIYWFTQSIGSSMRLYQETFGAGSSFSLPTRIEVPTGVSAFRDPNIPPRGLIEPWFNLEYYEEVDRGGHFPALENPDGFVEELRRFFRRYR